MIISNIEQGSEEWLEEKIGTIGGTRVKSIVTPAKLELSKSCDDLILKLVDENVTGISADGEFRSDAMDRGNELEPHARLAYTKQTGIDILEYGFCLSDKNKLHGLSPDGFTKDLKGAIEIKCPGFKHLKYIKGITSIFREYKPQCINYFIVNEKLEWLDTVSFRPEFYPNPIHIERIYRKDIEKEIDSVTLAINSFFEKYNIAYDEFTF